MARVLFILILGLVMTFMPVAGAPVTVGAIAPDCHASGSDITIQAPSACEHDHGQSSCKLAQYCASTSCTAMLAVAAPGGPGPVADMERYAPATARPLRGHLSRPPPKPPRAAV